MEQDILSELYNQWSREAGFQTEQPASIEPLPGAGSNRRYYRLTGDMQPDGASSHTAIGVIGTSAEENRAFVRMSQIFTAKGLNTPLVYAVSADSMAYLQQDLGSVSLFDAFKSGRTTGEYSEDEVALLRRTISLLPRLQFEGAEAAEYGYPHNVLDREGVMFDLNYFKYDFLKFTDVEFNEYKLQADFYRLADDLLADDSNTLLYRDFQARNVMLCDGEPMFIDYQGARRGPIYYDVASFLWQASAGYSDELRQSLVESYFSALQPFVESDSCPECYRGLTLERFTLRLHLFVLFRTIQVLGAYGYRGLWEKKRHFIDSIPQAVENLRAELDRGTCTPYPYLEQVCRNIIAWQQRRAESRRGGIRVYSFSFKKGIPEDTSGNGGGYVFDCRSSNNPGRYDEYKKLTGLDQPVIDFLEKDGEILTFLDGIYPLVDFHVQRWIDRGFTDLQISCGCTGGRHRSVYSAQHIAEHINKKFGVEVYLEHREQGIKQTLSAQTHE